MPSINTIQNRTISKQNTYQTITQMSIFQFINQLNLLLIMKSEYIDNLKKIENIRFLQLNVNRIRSCNEKKIQYFIEVCNLHRVDCFILTEMNIKWTISITDKIKNKLKNLGRELQLSFADSTNYTATTIDWLQGGIINSIRVAIANLCNPTLFHKDKLGK